MKKAASVLFVASTALCVPLWGQHSAPVATSTVVNPVSAAPKTDNITGTQTMIVNRSRELESKGKVDASGTLYVSVRESDLAGKTPAQIAQRLAPTVVTQQQKVKTVDVVVDVERPLFITTAGKDPFTIGTTIVDGKLTGDLQVNSNITLGEVKITKRN